MPAGSVKVILRSDRSMIRKNLTDRKGGGFYSSSELFVEITAVLMKEVVQMTLFGFVVYVILFLVVTTMADAFVEHRHDLEERDKEP